MATHELVIGVDIGTQSTKAALMSVEGRLLARHAESYPVEMPRPLWAQQPAQPWLDAVRRCIREVVDAGRRDGVLSDGGVRAVAISGLYGGSGIPVDQRLDPLHPCLIWMDRRAEAQVRRVRETLDLDELRRITGNGVDSYYGYTKMMWLRDEVPELWQRTWKLLPPNAWVIARLTGEVAIDHSSAGNLGGVYDLPARNWSDTLLQRLDIPRGLMPDRLVASHEVVGTLRREEAPALGLPTGTPIVAGGVDAAVATLAAGAVRPGRHVAMLGTSMCWGTVRDGHEGGCGLITMPHVASGHQRVYTFGGALTAGAAEVWCRQALWGSATPQPDALEREAAALPAGADGLLFLPYLMGERSPVWDARASGSLLGLGLRHGRMHLYRAVLEGVAFALQHNIASAMTSTGTLDEALIVVGGAARSDLWMQIVADVTGRPVLTLAEDVEATQGAAMLAAHGVGLIDEAAMARGWVQPVLRATPDPDNRAIYSALYEQYVAAYPALAGVMHGIASAGSA